MPITDPTKAIAQINRLLSAFPAAGNADPDALLMRYIEAISEHEFCDIENAVTQFLRGSVPGQNPRFAPTPPEVATVCRREMEKRLDDRNRHRAAVRQIEARSSDVPKNAETRARVKALVASAVKSLSINDDIDHEANERRRQEMLRKHDERFKPTLNYTVGDPEGNKDAGEAA